MSVATASTPRRVAGSELINSVQQHKAEQRASKRENSRVRALARQLFVLVAFVFAAVGLGAGTASAAPWDIKEDLEASINYFCEPMDVPMPTSQAGIDTTLGLNSVEDSNRRATVIPDAGSVATDPVEHYPRVEAAYVDKVDDIKPRYERYGFSALRWDNYGGNCFSPFYWFNSMSNVALVVLVHLPTIFAMMLLDLAMGNTLYDVFTTLIQFPVGIITAIFVPWIYIVAPVGVIVVWISTRSAKNTIKASVWAVLMLGTVLWMGNNTSGIVRAANNIVTEMANIGAARFADDGESAEGENSEEIAPGLNSLMSDTDTSATGGALDGVNQALWYGVPYQAWLEGSIGPEAAADARAEDRSAVTPSWGALLLNGNYVGDDEDGRKVLKATADWNSRSYMNDGKDTKTDAWTDEALWRDSPYLFNIKVMCGDTAPGGDGSNSPDDNRWMYNGECNATTAGNADVAENFKGNHFNQRIFTALAGCVASLTVALATGGVSIYLAVMKMLFYFMLLLAPVFLTVSSFSDEKRAGIGKRYFELMGANVLKQIVAVLLLMFIARTMSMLLYPPSGEAWSAIREMPWMLKPILAVFFFLAMVMFARPMTKIISGAARGDRSVVDKAARAPIDAAKTTAKVGAGAGLLAGAAALTIVTGGAAAPVLAKGATALGAAGRVAGRGSTGRALRRAGSVTSMVASGSQAYANSRDDKAAMAAGVAGMLEGEGGNALKNEIAAAGGLNEDGNLNARGQAMASKRFKETAREGMKNHEADARKDAFMASYYEGHRRKTGEYHAMDPNSPENKRTAALSAAVEREEVRQAAEHSMKKEQNTDSNDSGTPNSGAGAAGAAGAAAGAAGAAVAGGAGADGAATVDPTQVDAQAKENAQQAFAAQARENVEGPLFARDPNIQTTVAADGEQVLASIGLTKEGAAANPAELITSAYNDGNPAEMDPMHPATQHLNELRFAMVNGTDEEVNAASQRASEAIMEHGVPAQISGVGSVGETAQSFEGAQIVGAMPSINESTTWQERAEGASTMQAAAMLLPEGDPAQQSVSAYVSALSNPGVDAPEVEALRTQAIDALGASDQSRAAAAEQGGYFAAAVEPAAVGATVAGAAGVEPTAAQIPAQAPTASDVPQAPQAAAAEQPSYVEAAPVQSEGPAAQIPAQAPTASDVPQAPQAAAAEQADYSEIPAVAPDQAAAATAPFFAEPTPAAPVEASGYSEAAAQGGGSTAYNAPQAASAEMQVPADAMPAAYDGPTNVAAAESSEAAAGAAGLAAAAGAAGYVAGPSADPRDDSWNYDAPVDPFTNQEQGYAAPAGDYDAQRPAAYDGPDAYDYDTHAGADYRDAGAGYVPMAASGPSWDQAPAAYDDRQSYDTDDYAPADYRNVPGYSDADYVERIRYEDSEGPAPYNADYDGFQGHPAENDSWSPTTHESGAPLIAPMHVSAPAEQNRGDLNRDVREAMREARREEQQRPSESTHAESARAERVGPDPADPRARDRSNYVASAEQLPTQSHGRDEQPTDEEGRFIVGQGTRTDDDEPKAFRRSKRRRRSTFFTDEERNDGAQEDDR